MHGITDDAAWEAVMRRDGRLDGRFVFAVSSTGIYCRPSCPARRPRRENVRFFARNGDAEEAGFRPCKRCEPTAEVVPLAERVRALLDAADDGEERLTLAELGRRVGASAFHLQRTFKARYGVTPKQYLAGRRAERLREQLKEGKMIATATYEAGYGSSSRMYEAAAARLGMTPSVYRRGGEGMSIRYTVAATSLGRLLVGITDRGICAVSLGDDERALERALRDEFPRADLRRGDDGSLAGAVRAIVGQLESGTPATDLPLDLDASAFEIRVWNALRMIPYGETRSYSDVARSIGQPAAARAVARACARNRVAVVIPCHRVVRRDGDAGGYRWGSNRKRQILEREKG
jgi:AraC family transcriptional regulator, regulatory protein of adaptative response / methylated-DNA-[protein]-cysteine methyltransferase